MNLAKYILIVLASVLLAHGQAAFGDDNFEFVWEGRLTKENGAPVDGPVALTISFFHGPGDAEPVLSVVNGLDNVPLLEGIFQVKLLLSPTQYTTIFPRTSQPVYVQVTNRSDPSALPYPRQQIAMIPYAARVPVDDSTVTFDSQGRLTVQSVPQAIVSGLSSALDSKTSRQDVENLIASSLAQGHTHTTSDITDLGQILSTKASTDQAVTGDVTGTLTGTVVSRLRGRTLPAPVAADTGKFIQFNGNSFSYVSGSTGTVTNVTAGLPLSVTNPTTNPRIEIRQATAGQSGYLAPEDFVTFSAKQNAINQGTSLSAGSLTTAMRDGVKVLPYGSSSGETGRLLFQSLTGNTVGLRAPDNVPSNTLWTLPPQDGGYGQVLATDGSGNLSWNTPLPQDKPAGTYTKVTTNDQGLVTSGSTLSASDIPSLDASKITTGHLKLPGNPSDQLEAAPKQYVDAVKNAIPADAKASLYGRDPIDYSLSSGEIGLKGLSGFGSANQLMGMNSAASALEYKSLSGTDKQISVSNSGPSIILSLPQNISTDSSPSFAGMTVSGLSQGIVRSSGSGILSSSTVNLGSGDVSGVLPIANGGTGLTATPGSGQFLAGDGSTGAYTPTSIVTGPLGGVTTSLGSGTITLDTVQDLRSTATPSFAGINLASAGVNTPSLTASEIKGTPANAADMQGSDLSVSGGAGQGTGSSGAIVFKTGDSGSTGGSTLGSVSTRMTITPAGNIGIATTAPTARMEIATGSGTTPGLIVRATDGSQSADLTQWKDASGNVLSFINKDGFITLPDAPTLANQAATKKYVDDEINALSSAVDDLTTDQVEEGNNLYFTGDRARSSISSISPLEYSSSSGQMSLKGLSDFGSSNQLMGVTAAGGSLEYKTLNGTANQVAITHSAGGISLSLPQDIAPSSSPAFTNLSLTGPTAGVMKVGFGGGVTTSKVDLATTGVTEEVTGTLPISKGGTGLSAAPISGQLMIGNSSSGYSLGSIEAGTGVVVTNASGSISIATSQDIGAGSTPSFLGLTVGSGGLNSIAKVATPLAIIGGGDQTDSTSLGTLRGANAVGTDKSGGSLKISAGNGTGAGGSGDILFQTANADASGEGANTMGTRMSIAKDGTVRIGTSITSGLIVRPGAEGQITNIAEFTTPGETIKSGVGADGLFFQNASPTTNSQLTTKQYVDAQIAAANQNASNDLGTDLSLGGAPNQFWNGTKQWLTVNTSVVDEGDKKFFTEERSRNSLTSLEPVSYDASTGTIGLSGLSGLGAANKILAMNNSGTSLEYKTIEGTAKQVSVDLTTTPGTIKLSTPQNISSADSPTFTGMTLSSMAGSAGVVHSSAAGVLSNSLLDLNADTSAAPLAITKGGTGQIATPTQGQLLIGTSTGGFAPANLSKGAFESVTITNGSGTIALDTVQDIRTTASPTFTGLTANSGGIKSSFVESSTIKATAASGTDISGTALSLEGGVGTGTGSSGGIQFRTGPGGGTSGSTTNALSTRMTITPAGNVGIATSTASGRLQINTGADTVPGLIVRATNGTQSADLTQWLSSSGTVLSKIDKDGFLTLPNDPASAMQAATKKYVDDAELRATNAINNLTTTNVPEGTRLYYTDARARAAISARPPLDYIVSDGILSLKGLSALGSANQLLGMNAAGTSMEYKTLSSSTNILVTQSAGGLSLDTAQGIKTSDSPAFAGLTVSGLSTGVMKTNATGVVSSSAVGLDTADVSGVLPITKGGTGLSTTPTNGQLLIGNSTTSTYGQGTLTPGSNASIVVTNSPGAITLDTVQDIRTTAKPTFDGLNIGSFGLSSPTLVAGTGDGTGTATGGTVRAANVTGSNQAGKALTIDAGMGTGNQGSGNIVLRTAPAGGNTGTTATMPVERLVIDASGNVGIGSSAPNALLDLYGASAMEAKITSTASTAQLTTNGTSGGVLLNTIGDQSITNASATGAIKFATNNAERMRILADGNVGIGTTSPQSKLDINGTIRASEFLFGEQTSDMGFIGFSPAYHKWGLMGGRSLVIGELDDPVGIVFRQTDETIGNLNTITSLNGTMKFRTHTYNATRSDIDTTVDAMTISPSGNIGIRTTSPGAKLDIGGSGESLRLSGGAAQTYMTFYNGATRKGYIGTGAGGTDMILNADAGSVILQGGNVGIGTSNPQATLDVNGTIRASSFLSSSGSSNFSAQGINNVSSLSIGTTTAGTDIFFGSGSDRTMSVQSSSTAGNSLTVRAGGTSATTGDVNGGNLVLSSGAASGTGTSQIQFQTASGSAPATAMTILGDGNVGIGTTVPSTKLDVGGATRIGGGYGSSSNVSSLVIGAGGASPDAVSFSWGDGSGWKSHFGTRIGGVFTPRVTFVDNGRVGIGTTSPAAAFHLHNGNGLISSDIGASKLTIKGTDNSSFTSTAEVNLDRDSAYRGGGVRISATSSTFGTGQWWAGVDYGAMGSLNQYQIGYHATSPEMPANALLSVLSSGNVGIGTTAPAALLQVNGDATFNLMRLTKRTSEPSNQQSLLFSPKDSGKTAVTQWAGNGANGSHFELFGVGDPSQSNYEVGRISFNVIGSNEFRFDTTRLGTGVARPINFYPGGSNLALSLNTNGNVGIGTTAPQATLDVNGTIRASSFLSSSGSSDFSAQGINNVSSLSIGTTTAGTDIFFGSGSDRTMSVQSSSTAGNSLTVRAGGTSATTGDVNGGNLVLSSGSAYGTGTSQIQFQTASGGAPATAMTILGNGNVGIGTTAPASSTLHVYGNALIGANASGGANVSLQSGGIANTRTLAVYYQSGGTSGSSNGDFSVVQSTYQGVAATPLTLNPYGGTVGIGTTSPNSILDIVGGALVLNGGLNNTSTRPAVATSRITGEVAGYSAGGFTADDGFLRLSAGGGTNATAKSFIDLSGYSTQADMNNNLVFGTAGTERMRILSNGNVGIGTTSPTAKLEVSGSLKAGSFSRSSDSFTIQLPNAGNNWFKLGTWASTTQGARAEIELVAGSYYNASPAHEGITHIQMSMGNGASGVPNITGYFWAEGGVAAVSQMKAVMANTCTSGISCAAWDIYAFVRPNTGGDNFVEVKVGPSSTWTNSMTSATDPGAASNDIVEFRHQLTIPTGNVGIGSISPTSRLDVNGDVTIADKVIHAGDTDTAIRFPSTDTVTVETAGSERIRISSTGNIGIGTTSASFPLTLVRDQGVAAGAYSTMMIGRSIGSGASLILGYGADGEKASYGFIRSVNGQDLRLATMNTIATGEGITVINNGNVGIGTTVPTATLDVNGTVRASSFVSSSGASNFSAQGINNVSSLSIGTTTAGTDIFFGSGSDRTMSVQASTTAGNSLTVQAGGTSAATGNVNGGNLVLASGAAYGTGTSQIQFQTASGGAPATAMTILGNGNVGIGTTAPGNTLAVVGSASFGTTSQGRIAILGDAGNERITSLDAFSIDIDADNNSTNSLFQITKDGGTSLMRVQENGHVGIGTTSPTAKLEVGGAIKGSSLDVQGAWSQLYVGAAGNAGMIRFRRSNDASPQGYVGYASAAESSNLTIKSDGGSGFLTMHTAAVERMRIGTDGNVGIGTTAPTATLDVNGTVRASSFVSTSGASDFSAQGINNVSSLSIGTTTAGTDIFFGSGSDRTMSVQSSATAGNNLTVRAGGTSATTGDVNGGNLVLSAGSATGTGTSQIQLQTASGGAPVTAMTILGNGNVGIGTTAPELQLDIVGSKFGIKNAVAHDHFYVDVGWESTKFRAGGAENGMQFEVSGGGGGAYGLQSYKNVMSLMPSGNVGIGTTSPGAALEIVGPSNGSLMLSGVDGSANPAMQMRLGSTAYSTLAVGHSASQYGVINAGDTILRSESTSSRLAFFNGNNFGSGLTIYGNNVGIGTTNPTYKLQVDNGDALIGYSAGVTGGVIVARTATYGAPAIQGVTNALASNILALNPSGGNVGIGTTSPANRLSVNGSANVTGNVGIGMTNPLFTLSTSSTGRIATSVLRLQNSYLDTDAGFGIQLAGIDNGSNGHDLHIQGRTTATGAFNSLMTVKNSGNVGIGTTTPSAKLSVIGGIHTNASDIISGGGLHLQWNRSGFEGESWIINQKGLATNGNDGIRFGSATTTNVVTEWARINGNGNVGIGTTAPASTLQVKGQITTVLPNELAPTGTTQTVDFATGNMQMVSLASASGNVTLTLSNPVAGGSYAIKFTQGTTARAVIWPANVKWPEGNVMALSTVSGAIDLVTLFYDGTAYLAVGGRNFY